MKNPSNNPIVLTVLSEKRFKYQRRKQVNRKGGDPEASRPPTPMLTLTSAVFDNQIGSQFKKRDSPPRLAPGIPAVDRHFGLVILREIKHYRHREIDERRRHRELPYFCGLSHSRAGGAAHGASKLEEISASTPPPSAYSCPVATAPRQLGLRLGHQAIRGTGRSVINRSPAGA
jgi:hypothetical protein